MAMYWTIIKPNQNTINSELSFWEKRYLSTKILRNDPGFFLNLLVYMNPGKYFNFGQTSVRGGRYLWNIINRILLLMKRQYTNKDSILNKQTCFWTLFGYLVACVPVCVYVCVRSSKSFQNVSCFVLYNASIIKDNCLGIPSFILKRRMENIK